MLILWTFPVIYPFSIRKDATATRPIDPSSSLGRGLSLWLREGGLIAAKDQVSVQEYLKIENQSGEKLDKVREPALKVAQALLN